jgi:hypothetical protein
VRASAVPRLGAAMTVASVVATCAVAVSRTPAFADQAPTTLAARAQSLGITKSGSHYRYVVAEQTGDEGRLTVEFPTAWSDQAPSQFRRPNTGEPYGVGLRATTNADKFHNTFAVPGMKVTATTDVPTRFDAAQSLADNAYEGCRTGRTRSFDNGRYQGRYQTFDRCGRQHAAAVVVSALSTRGDVMILASGQVLTKNDLAAIDHALDTLMFEKPSI